MTPRIARIESERRGLPINAPVNDDGDGPYIGVAANFITCPRQGGEGKRLRAAVAIITSYSDMNRHAVRDSGEQQGGKMPGNILWHRSERMGASAAHQVCPRRKRRNRLEEHLALI